MFVAQIHCPCRLIAYGTLSTNYWTVASIIRQQYIFAGQLSDLELRDVNLMDPLDIFAKYEGVSKSCKFGFNISSHHGAIMKRVFVLYCILGCQTYLLK